MEEDFYAFQHLSKKYPSRCQAIRYEDLSLAPETYSKEIFQFYGLPYHQDVKKYIESHTARTKEIPFKWKISLSRPEIQMVQKNCESVMALWGYKLYEDTENITSFIPIL